MSSAALEPASSSPNVHTTSIGRYLTSRNPRCTWPLYNLWWNRVSIAWKPRLCNQAIAVVSSLSRSFHYEARISLKSLEAETLRTGYRGFEL
ncbi:hypothetical protein AVEN_169475-1 [Araneus ventricosus]|uniref:Uncharacterized protein n=1 Tax=Araneus ventricosus TaxID=182803 RepID=A0A4Y2LE14_ARAVE|nr:hypothetical protein AVEN_46709-1 [Araneus ventricosus]GBN12853.1 hypothetical protein AVEN_46710-1 [Araneus ventricosus]GBN12869.1 hypothetical protein AVEN_61674-1 [Araneus ventricosus]GBN12871.1 hypothetical protein AVEN_61675-1 [Araneus ventricosus]GBN12926.1 hypothetical protein AVEN_104991-1 [Araneus ventricosus]